LVPPVCDDAFAVNRGETSVVPVVERHDHVARNARRNRCHLRIGPETAARSSEPELEDVQPDVEIVEADLNRADHQRDVIALTAAYALDEMGNGGPLAPDVLDRLVPGLRSHPTALILVAYAGGKAVGIATCFRGFSTFAGRPLINIHDLAVLPSHRGRGVGTLLLDAVARKARELGCCKVTLEVVENNTAARRLYAKAGFSQAVYGGEGTGGALFYAKPL
jgi:GNAT superfamily N-acetyltransferase